ncbi:MAG: nickel transporter permease [Desulfurispora sp.]|uniref:nickel transporter permease n=1 Tax=Desulfurispora sp. TaxID=3014275 RepID=UPI004049581C
MNITARQMPDVKTGENLLEGQSRHVSTRARGLVGRLAKDRMALLGLGVIMLLALLAVLAPWLAPHDPVQINLEQSLQPPGGSYWLGTDHLGRCVFSRLLWGARVSLGTALLALGAILLISLPLGLLAGYCGGRVDNLIMRLVDVVLAFPGLILALVISGMLGPGLLNMMLALAGVWWAEYARLVRGQVLAIKERDFVLAARAVGAGPGWLMLRHLLPAALGPVIVLATLDMGKLILAISGLSFLGLGAQPPTPEWGTMLSDARPYLQTEPRLMLAPGLCIMLVALAFNLLGDGLAQALHPQENKCCWKGG